MSLQCQNTSLTFRNAAFSQSLFGEYFERICAVRSDEALLERIYAHGCVNGLYVCAAHV